MVLGIPLINVTCVGVQNVHLEWRGALLTFKDGAELSERPYGPPPGVLAHGKLHVEQRDPAQQQHHQVRQQEGAATRLWIDV